MVGKKAYRVDIDESVLRYLSRLPQKTQRQIAKKIDSLAVNPRPQDTKLLRGQKDLYRIRSGDYRILYTIYEDEVYVYVIGIGHRKDVYRKLLGR